MNDNGGYTAIPNCLPDIYMPIVSDVQYKVLECIVRKTLGWHKRWDGIALSQFEEMTGNSRPAIVRAIADLVELKIILCGKGQGRSSSQYALNSGYDTFELLVKQFNQLSKLTSNAELLLEVKQINCYALVVVKESYPQKKALKETKENDHDHDLVPPPETEDEERHDKITNAFKKAIGSNDITLVSNDYQREAFDALMEYPDEKILHVIQKSGEKGKLHQDNAITYVKKGLEHYDSWYAGATYSNVGNSKPSQAEVDSSRAISSFTRLVAEYRTLSSDTGVTRQNNNKVYMIRLLQPYRKWYDTIDNFGTITGMELDEYETLMAGGAK